MNDPYQFPVSPPTSPTIPLRPRSSRRKGFIIGGLAFIVALGVGSMTQKTPDSSPAVMTSPDDIKEYIASTALHRPVGGQGSAGGVLGPWWIHASGRDSGSGDLLSFCLESEDTHLAAKRVRISVNVEDHTVSLVLIDAVLVELPGSTGFGRWEHHPQMMVGPIPLLDDIRVEAPPIGETNPKVTMPS